MSGSRPAPVASRGRGARSLSASGLRGLAGVAVGVAAGYVCSRLHTPIPWMLGPLVAMAVLRVAGAPSTRRPARARSGSGSSAPRSGSTSRRRSCATSPAGGRCCSPARCSRSPPATSAACVLSRLAGIDRTTAMFASVPGGATEMAVLGERFGARVDRVAAAQSLRILVVVIVIPFAYALARRARQRSPTSAGAGDVRARRARAAAAGDASPAPASRNGWRVPNAFILGALAVAIPLTAAGVHAVGAACAALQRRRSACWAARWARASSPISCAARRASSLRSRRRCWARS